VPFLAVNPRGFHDLQGIGAGFVPDVLRVDLIDEVITVTDEQAYDLARRLAREEGIISGISTGAALYAGLQVGTRSQHEGQLMAIVQPSAGERYLSTPLWA
jgi:cysteine synthase (EC 2.5.1.47)